MNPSLEMAIVILQGDGKRDEVVSVLMSRGGLSEEEAHEICSRAQRGELRDEPIDAEN